MIQKEAKTVKVLDRLLNTLAIGFNGYLLLAFILLIVSSLRWILVHDAALMMYIGFAIDTFDLAPYRDIYDMNPPASYLLYALISKMVGSSNKVFRIVDVSLLLLFFGVVTSFVKSHQGWRWALVPSALFGISLLNFGAAHGLQREFLGLCLIAVTFGSTFRSFHKPLSSFEMCTIGFLAGVYILIKPPFLMYFCLVHLFIILASVTIHSHSIRTILISNGVALLGFLSFPMLVVLYFWSIGCLTDFIELVTNYWPLYSKIDGNGVEIVDAGRTLVEKIRLLYAKAKHIPALYPLPIGVVLGGFLFVKMETKERLLYLFLTGVVVSSFVYVMVSKKMWLYHYIPLYFSLSLWSGYSLYLCSNLIRNDIVRICGSIAMMGLIVFQTEISLKDSFESSKFFWKHGFSNRIPGKKVRPVVEHFKAHLQPGEKVQPLDVVQGALHAMLIQEVEIATPFVYDFNMYHHVSDPYVQKLRRRFLDSLQKGEAAIIVDNQRCHWMRHVNKMDSFPELYSWIEQNYTKVEETDCFDFWHKKSSMADDMDSQ